jgi:heme/copper-type cytochrome/quinol oxidase subunit 3
MFPLYTHVYYYYLVLLLLGLHKAIILGSYKESIDSFFLTIFLGLCFFVLQMMEYMESPFSFNTSVMGCSFFMLTGLHGFHVFVGI